MPVHPGPVIDGAFGSRIWMPGCPAPHEVPASQGEKMPVSSVIEGALGSRLCGISMVDMPSYTHVEVVVHATYEPQLVDPQAQSNTLSTLMSQARSNALSTMMHAFQILGPQIESLQVSPDKSQVHLKYLDTCPDRICWEFGQYGSCPRPKTCRWEHAVAELFVITLVMKPLLADASPMAVPLPVGALPNGPGGALPNGMMGYVANTPMPPIMDQVPGMVYVPVAVMTGNPSIGPDCLHMKCGGQQQKPNTSSRGAWSAYLERAKESEQTSSTTAASSERSGSSSPTDLLSPCGTPRECWPDTDYDEDA